jgi:hypothetical protein
MFPLPRQTYPWYNFCHLFCFIFRSTCYFFRSSPVHITLHTSYSYTSIGEIPAPVDQWTMAMLTRMLSGKKCHRYKHGASDATVIHVRFSCIAVMSSPVSSLTLFTCWWCPLLPPRWLHLPADDVLSCLLDDFIYVLSPASSMTSFTCSLLPPRWFHLPAADIFSYLIADFFFMIY